MSTAVVSALQLGGVVVCTISGRSGKPGEFIGASLIHLPESINFTCVKPQVRTLKYIPSAPEEVPKQHPVTEPETQKLAGNVCLLHLPGEKRSEFAKTHWPNPCAKNTPSVSVFAPKSTLVWQSSSYRYYILVCCYNPNPPPLAPHY